MVNAFDHLAESTLVDDSDDLVAVAQLFAYLSYIVAFFVSYLVLILSTNFSYSIDFLKDSQFDFFEFG